MVTVVCAESIDADASTLSAAATAVERRRNRFMAGLFEGGYGCATGPYGRLVTALRPVCNARVTGTSVVPRRFARNDSPVGYARGSPAFFAARSSKWCLICFPSAR